MKAVETAYVEVFAREHRPEGRCYRRSRHLLPSDTSTVTDGVNKMRVTQGHIGCALIMARTRYFPSRPMPHD
jgi:hypothetical protein